MRTQRTPSFPRLPPLGSAGGKYWVRQPWPLPVSPRSHSVMARAATSDVLKFRILYSPQMPSNNGFELVEVADAKGFFKAEGLDFERVALPPDRRLERLRASLPAARCRARIPRRLIDRSKPGS
jgi:hypothetical protein